MPDQHSWVSADLESLQRQGLIRHARETVPLPDGWCEIDGKKLRDFASNDYLNLSHDPRVIEAARDALETAGAGSRASALIAGRTKRHVQLEERLAEFEGQDAAIVFPSGYAANVGTISALADSEDIVFCDRLNHASLVDGCRLSGAKFRVFRHRDLAKLDRELAKAADHRRRFIVTDGIFSMDADLAPLPELCDLAERHNASIIVDEAHGTGVFGETGRGVSQLQQVEDRIAVRIGTLSKSVGSLGGFVTGPRPLIDWLFNCARTQMFSTALPPSACAAACKSIEIIQAEPERRQRLLHMSEQFRTLLRQKGIDVLPDSTGPIVPIILKTPEAVTRAAAALESQDFLVAAIRPPTVPVDTSRLRITISRGHTPEDLQKLSDALRSVILGAN